MKSALKKQVGRRKRAQRVRRRIKATGRVRLSIYKSNRHLHVQLIDDQKGVTVAGLSTNSKELASTEFTRVGITAAKEIGRRIGERAKEKGVEKVVLDRGYLKYAGVIAALADAARETGLKF